MIDNVEFLEEIIKSQDQGKPTERLWFIFVDMAKCVKFGKTYVRYPEDWIMDAVIHCIEKYDKFDITYTNPFSYFTSLIENEYRKYINETQWEKAENWNARKPTIDNPYTNPVWIDNKWFATMPEALEFLGISRGTFYNNWLYHGIPEKKSVNKITFIRAGQEITLIKGIKPKIPSLKGRPKSTKRKQKPKPKPKLERIMKYKVYEYRYKMDAPIREFATLKDLAKFYNVTDAAITRWMKSGVGKKYRILKIVHYKNGIIAKKREYAKDTRYVKIADREKNNE